MKKSILSALFFVCSLFLFGQTAVLEMFYNVNGHQLSALCVLNGSEGKCSVKSSSGNCWFDASYTNHGSYSTIATSNPSDPNWIPSVIYFTSNGNYMVVQNYKFAVAASMIPQSDWNLKKAQYGFRIDGTSFRGKQCTYPIGASTCSKLHYCSGFQEGKTITTCKHCPHDISWHK